MCVCSKYVCVCLCVCVSVLAHVCVGLCGWVGGWVGGCATQDASSLTCSHFDAPSLAVARDIVVPSRGSVELTTAVKFPSRSSHREAFTTRPKILSRITDQTLSG